MRLRVVFIAFVLLRSAIITAQPATFLKLFNRGNQAFAVREQNMNSYLVAGGTNYYYNYHWMQQSPLGMTGVHLFRTNTLGSLIWEKVYSVPGTRSIGIWMEPTMDGGSITTGHINSEMLWPPDSNDIILIKTDASGVVLWSKKFDTGGDELGYCVRQTADNGYAISGFHDAAPVSVIGTTYALLIKTDANGNIVWNKKYQLPVRDFDTGESFPVVFRQVADGGYVLISTTMGAHQADVCVIRTNVTGDVLWSKSYEHDNTSFRLSTGQDIMEASNGEIIVAGSMDKNRLLNQFNYPFIMKLSATGSIIDTRILSANPDMMFQSGFSSVEQTPDGGFFFTGMGGYGGFGDQAQLLKTDNQFNMQWSRVYTWDGMATMGSRCGRRGSDGYFIFAGKRQFTGSVLMKTNSSGIIPCKNPGVLTEIFPAVLEINRAPAVLSGINATNLILNTQGFLADSSIVCPVIITSLPVELISFSAKRINNSTVQLRWSTASEINTLVFVVERSADGKSFIETGSVAAAGNSTSNIDYIFEDAFHDEGAVVYYRLRIIDHDGTFKYSDLISLNSKTEESVSVSFLTNSDGVYATLSGFRNDMIDFRFLDVLGRRVLEGRSDSNPVHLKLKTKGVYFYSFTSGTKEISGKIVVY